MKSIIGFGFPATNLLTGWLVLLIGSAAAAQEDPTSSMWPDSAVLQRYATHYDDAIQERQYAEAEVAAKQMIEHLIRSGSGNRPLAHALVRLAAAQRKSERREAALQNYGAAIGLLEESENRLSPTLIEPVLGVANTWMESGRADMALPVFDRALHLQHVNGGPHSLEQTPILQAIAAAQQEVGDNAAALATLERAQKVNAREFGADSEQVLPALEQRADLLNRLGRYGEERVLRRQMVRVIEKNRGDAALPLFEPYSALGRTYLEEVDEVIFRSEPTTETGETWFRKALDVAERNPAANDDLRARAYLQLGDYYTVLDVQDKARRSYRAAWKLMSSEDGREQRASDLEGVVPLRMIALDGYAHFGYRGGREPADDVEYLQGHVELRFTVNERGRVTDIEVVEADPEFPEMQTRVERALRQSVFRPRYRDGSPVRTTGERFRHDFMYREGDVASGS